MRQENGLIKAGKDIKDAGKALIMIHGRGANAEDIISLSQYFNLKDFAIVAPQAPGNTWYPYSFMVPQAINEPWLSSSLQLLKETLNDITQQGISAENIYFLGFSQGACLLLEFVARNADRYGGITAFTGGLLGDRIVTQNYNGDFKNTPIFIGTSDPDPHVPAARVRATTAILQGMNADVTERVYENMGHTISQDEIDEANRLIFTS